MKKELKQILFICVFLIIGCVLGYFAALNQMNQLSDPEYIAFWTSQNMSVPEPLGFTRSILDEIKAEFPAFLEKGLKENPMKCEYFLPSVVSNLLESERATVQVLESEDKWYGVTYKEDKPVVVEAIQALKDAGEYPQKLWEED